MFSRFGGNNCFCSIFLSRRNAYFVILAFWSWSEKVTPYQDALPHETHHELINPKPNWWKKMIKMKHDFAVVFVVLNCSRTSHGGCRCKFATTTGWIRTCSTHVVGEPQIIEPLAEWRSLKWLPKKKSYKNWWLGWPVWQCEGRSGKKKSVMMLSRGVRANARTNSWRSIGASSPDWGTGAEPTR
jgi:hypothetical protein